MGVYADVEAATEASLEIADGKSLTIAGQNATLYANLKMADNSYLNLNGGSLNLGSVLTLGGGIALDEATLRALDGLDIGETRYLINPVEGHTISYTDDQVWYDQVFTRTAGGNGDYVLQGDFRLVNEAVGFGLVKFSNVPELASGTLSLLGMAALAARRRRR